MSTPRRQTLKESRQLCPPKKDNSEKDLAVFVLSKRTTKQKL